MAQVQAQHTMNSIFSSVQYWSVYHPKILHFSWTQGQTIGSSPLFLTITVLSYLFLTFLLSRISLPYVQPYVLRSISAVHNITLLTLSFIMAVGCTVSIFTHAPHIPYVICFPTNTKPAGPLFFWGYIFYLSKILEFMDTLLIIMSNSIRRLSFLHVYHHATVLIMCFVSVHTAQSSFPVVLVTNSVVHVVMYSYYLLCALGVRPRWKRLVTDLQILQFLSSFGIMVWILYYHFTGLGCSGIWGWFFNAVFITSLLVLFLDFHSKNYSAKMKNLKAKQI